MLFRSQRILHVDVGGGTTKLALIENGVVLGLQAFAVGGRLIAADAAGGWTRIDDSARLAAAPSRVRASENRMTRGPTRRYILLIV